MPIKLKKTYAAKEEIPAGTIDDLYEEKDGAFVLVGVDVPGSKTDEDVSRLSEALRKEKEDHKRAKEKVRAWGALVPEEVMAKLDELDELKQAGAGQLDEKKLNDLADARAKRLMAPLERELKQAKEDLAAKDAVIGNMTAKDKRRMVEDAVRQVVVTRVNPHAVEDVLLRAHSVFEVGEDGQTVTTREGVGVPAGLKPEQWLDDLLPNKPHWSREFVGGGADGGGSGRRMGDSKNPWSKAGWDPVAQGRYEEQHGKDKAEAMARSVGSSLDAMEPPAK